MLELLIDCREGITLHSSKTLVRCLSIQLIKQLTKGTWYTGAARLCHLTEIYFHFS